MKKVCVFLADGFEEIEGLTVVDILRRAGVETETVSVMGRKQINGSHGIIVEADKVFGGSRHCRCRYAGAAGRNAGHAEPESP